MAVLCTVVSIIKPECTDAFAEILGGMFAETSGHDGFINIRLLKSETTENEFILIQEWETIQHHQSYMAYRDERGDLAKLAAMTASPPQLHYWNAIPLASA